jgi:hypothetical protein
MHVPSEDELAAIALAYLAATAAAGTPNALAPSRWSLAGRLPDVDGERVRFAPVAASRWNAAGRLDG